MTAMWDPGRRNQARHRRARRLGMPERRRLLALGVLVLAAAGWVVVDGQPGAAASAPEVSATSPTSGSTAGGTSVIITGSGFTDATAVMFGSTATPSFTVNSDTSITAVAPAEPAWRTDVTVTASGETSATSAADQFRFIAATPTATSTPHVMEIMMENESPSDLFDTGDAPNVTALASDYGLATDSYSIGHPSEPNYLEMISGSNWGVTTDNTPAEADIASNVQTLVNQLEAAGVSWRAYFESMPYAGYSGGDTGGTDPYGGQYYLQHHNPFVYFPSVTSLSDFNADVVPLTGVTGLTNDLDAAGAPDYVWVTPNAVDDMHDGPELADGDTVPTAGDAWLATFIGHVQSTAWYAAGGQILVEWDEGADADFSGIGTAGEGGGGRIATLVVSAALAHDPKQDATPVNTAGVLHSVEHVYDLPYLEDAANDANGNIDGLLLAPPVVTSVSPNSGPAAGSTTVTVTGTNFTGATAVDFGSTPATGVEVVSDTTLTAVAPAGSGTVDVTVSGPGGTSTTSVADRFTYTGAPPVANGSYDMVGSDGGVFVFPVGSGAGFYGSLPGLGIHVSNIVGIVPTSDEKGYWLVGSDGGVFAFGDAGYIGSLPGLGVGVNDIVGIVPTSDNKGYWLVGRDGGVFAFGDATYVQSLPGLGVHVSNIVGIAPTATGQGYWLVGSDGAIYALGDAIYYGGVYPSTVPVVGIAAATGGKGYWLVAADGKVYPYGNATSYGDLPTLGVSVSNIVSLVPTPDGDGYWLIGGDGGVFAFGDATFLGSLPALGIDIHNVVGAVPTSG